MANFLAEISFSQPMAEKRIQHAQKIFGKKTVNSIIATALFLLGGKRQDIGKFFSWPIGTLFSLLNRFHQRGVMAFLDQRSRIREVVPPVEIQPPENDIQLIWNDQQPPIRISLPKNELRLETSQPIQLKTMILTLVNAGFMRANQASEILELTERRVHQLLQALQQEDVYALLDKRQGQPHDYKVTEKVKSELIQQFIANILTGRSTASTPIAQQLNQACDCTISDRWVRHYIKALGLHRIEKSLPELIAKLKKNSRRL